jgi:hypothetical protein
MFTYMGNHKCTPYFNCKTKKENTALETWGWNELQY